MAQIIILLGEVWYNPARSSRMFQNIKLNGHYLSALDFQKKYPKTVIIRKNHLTELKKFIANASPEPIVIIYCGHGSINNWSIGINKQTLTEITRKNTNKITIVSDCCFSDSMNITENRKNTIFISSARSSGEDQYLSAFFTFDGGYMSSIFYKEYNENKNLKQLKKDMLKHYYIDNSDDEHLPKFFKC